MGSDLAVEASGLTKSYKSVAALAAIDMNVARGTVFALLGPNGAGKTTAVRILATISRPDSGWARVAGFDVQTQRKEARRRLSLTGQHAAVDEMQTGEENLVMMARLRRLPRRQARQRAGDLLERFDLVAAGHRPVKTYSGGMRRRLDLAASLVTPPEVVFLDEPTTGLDPRSRQAMWAVIGELVETGVTVFLTTQYLEEADRLADRIAILDEGRIVAEGTAAELKLRVAAQRLDLTLVDAAAFADVSAALSGAPFEGDAGRLTIGIPTDGSATEVRSLLDAVDPQRSRVATFAVQAATLDDVFLALTGRAGDGHSHEIAHV